MNSSGRYSLLLVSVFMVMLTGLFLGATPADAAVTSGRTSDYSTSFPTAGGPYIIAATWDADNSTLYVVFNEAVADNGTDDVEEDDFLPIGFSFAGGGATLNTQPNGGVGIPSDADRRVVAITGFTVTPTAGIDSLGLATLADNVDADGFTGVVGAVPGPDHSRVPITLGPVVVAAEVDTDWYDLDGDMDDVTITLTFNVDIQGPAGGAYVDADFDSAPELVKLPNDPIIDWTFGTPATNQLTLTRNANGHVRGMWPGITKIYVDAGAVEDSDGATNSDCVAQTVMIENASAGPALLGTHFRSSDGASGDLLLVFHEPVDPASLAGVPGTQYTLAGGGSAWTGAETQDIWTGSEYSNIVVVEANGSNASDATLTVIGGAGPQDYQAQYTPAVTCSVKTAIGILRASYDRNGTASTPDDDVLEIIFSEPIANLNAVHADDFHFAPNGTGELIDNIWSEVTISATNESGGGASYGRVTVTDWQNATDLNGEPLPVGAFIKLDSGSNIKGTISGGVGGGAVNASHWVPIVQDREIWPAISTMVQEVDTYTSKYFDEGPTVATNDDIDHAFLAWREIGAVDHSDYWLLFFTNNGAGALTQVFIDTYLNDALPISNIHSQLTDANIIQRLQVDIAEGTTTTDGEVLMRGDEVWFMLVPMTYWGAIGPASSSLVFTKSFFVGPVCPPRDFVTDVDEDMIHIRAVWEDTDLDGIRDADEYTRYIWGDANSAPCGTTIHVWRRNERDTTPGATELGNGPIAGDGSFGPITLPAGANEEWALWLQAEEDGTYSDPVEILNDIHGVWLVLDDGNGTGATDDDLILHPDRFNPHRRYTANEHINCLVKAEDGVLSGGGSIGAMNDLLVLTADFSVVDNRTNLDATLGGDPLTEVRFQSLGRDSLDNDGDWDDTSPNTGNGNGDMDWPEPYKDEDGNGYFTPGEWFQDNNGNGLCDAPHGAGGAGDPAAIVYDWYLDCTDEDEHGWYEVQLLTATQYTGSVSGDSTCYVDVDKGFQLLDPVTDPTALGPEGGWVLKNLPFAVQDTVNDAAMVYDETAATNDPPMAVMIDEVPVTETKIDELMTLATLTTDPAGGTNLILPTDPTYHLGRYVQFQATTPADNDVSFGVAHLYTMRSGSWAWEPLVLDPPGTNATAGYPGVQDFDDDNDVVINSLLTNALDDDEDGTADNEEEGIDLHDPEVVDAMQASLAATTTAGVDTIWVSNDRIDNDNDAFFVMEVYWDENPATTTDVTQRITWYNLDESTNNNVDDDNDGNVDETTVALTAETELYDTPASDDNEDGIMDGEAVALTLDGAHKRIVWDVAWTGDIMVDATHILGQHPADFDGDVRASTEFIPLGHDVLRPNAILSTAFPGLGWGDTTTVTGVGANALSWYDTHVDPALALNANVDFQYIAQLYDMAVDGTTEYKLRIVGYDHTGLGNSANSDSITFTLDVTAPENLEITDCSDGDPTTGPADFVDVDAQRGGLQINDSGSYTLTVEQDEDAVSVQYYSRSSEDGGATWTAWAAQGALDVSRPYTAEYAPVALDNNPAGDSLLVQFRAIGTDEFGNAQDADSVCVFEVTVIDGTPPITWFSEIYNVVNPTDNQYWYRDTYGPVQVPVGPTIQLKAEFDDNDGVVGTNDVIRLVFDYRPVGVGGEWEHIMTYTGTVVVDPVTGDTLTIDFPGPIAVTLDTESMGTGSFDLRVYGCDFEGNCNILTPDMATITIVTEGLRAYVEDPYLNGGFQDLYAFNYIHDAEILTVEFQYYADTDGDHIDNDGNSWVKIAIDGGLTTAGDVLLRRGTDFYYDLTAAQHQAFPAALGTAGGEYFVDFDLNGYSDRDPVVTDTDGSGTWDTGEPVICGLAAELTNGQALTAFPADHFFTGGDADFDATEWIFKDNAYGTANLDLWYTQWDVTALSGWYLVRGVATDEYYAVDDSSTSPSVIPTRPIRIDPDPPYADITRVTKADGDTLDMTLAMYVAGSTGWIMLEATSSDEDIDNVLFQYSTNGGGAWTDLDLNDDNDFYADIDGDPGFQALGDDEIFLDDGDFVYSAGDVCIYDGGDLTVDTPLGTPLMPLIGEDPAGGVPADEDGDLMVDEDDNVDKKDYDEPYLIYFDFSAMNFLSNTDVLFRAVPTDQSGNVDATNASTITINVGETRPPETDIVSVYNADGDTLDVWKAIADGDGVMLLGAVAGDLAFTIHATAEDSTSISYVDLYSRWNATCYPDLEAWENPWASMSVAGYTTADSTYDYIFAVDMTGAPDGAYEFFPMGVDGNGNMTPAPEHPYAFRILNNRAFITTDLTGATYAVGDEVWFDADILTTPVGDTPTVNFYYAERVIDEVIDPTRISNSSPYISIALDPVMTGPATAGNHAILTINSTECTWHSSFTGLTGLTKYDWTMNGNAVQFGAVPAAGDTILIDYNLDIGAIGDYTDDWVAINAGDSYPPYTVAWDAGDGGIPTPTNAECEAYDIIATVDLGTAGDDECGLEETMVSEMKYIYLTDETLPVVDLYMKGGRHAALETYYPGNPSFDTVGDGADTEWKISGIEAEAIALQDPADVSVLTGVNLVIANSDTSYTTAMTLIPSTATMLYMTFTMYEEDYRFLAAGSEAEYAIENAWVALGGNNYQMAETTAGSGIWQVADVPVPVNATTAYQFFIDMEGDNHGLVDDARNYNVGAAASRIKLPAVPFYYAILNTADLLGETTSIWRAYTVATDEVGNVGTSDQMPFVYDPEKPTVSELIADTILFNETTDVDLWAECFDPTPSNLNIITVDEVVFQYCPNYYMADGEAVAPDSVQVWLTLGVDTDPTDGWAVLNINIPDPGDDNYDNDNDGDWDELDEDTVPMAFRAVPRDDGWNWGDAVVLGFTLDSTEPQAVLTAPLEGSIFTYEQLITLTAEITETQADIEYISIQYSLDGTTWPALPYNPAAPGTGWVDPTPEDNSDNPYLYAEPYTTTLDPADYPDFAEADRYVRFRAQAVDAAGNEDADPPEIIVVLDDITGPTAYPMWAMTTGGAAWVPINDPFCQITGTAAQLRATFIDPTATGNIASVTFEYALPAAEEDWYLIDIIDLPAPATWTIANTQGTCDATWDVSGLAEGEVLVRTRAKDGDGNYGENPLVRSVTIDHTAPAIVYDPATVGNGFPGFVNFVAYVSDGVVGETSNVIVPDPETGDVTFYVATPDPTVASITLQERTAGDAQGAWTDWAPGDPGATDQFMYEPNLNFQTDATDYYVWILRVHDFVDHPDGVAGAHEIRGLAVDAAGNANILHDTNNPWDTYTVDTADPECVSMTHSLPADQVAAGDPVTFYFEGTDALTDIVVVRFEYDEVGGLDDWQVIDPDPETPEIEAVDVTPVEGTMDTDYPRWTAEITWTTPTYPVLTTDTAFNVRAVMYDSPMNNLDPTTPATCAIAAPINVEDMTAPMYTKMWAIPDYVDWTDDPSGAAGTYDGDCENGDHDGMWVDLNGVTGFQTNTADIAIDYGDGGGILTNGDPSDGWLAQGGNTWPTYIDEDVIDGNGLGEMNDIILSDEVVLVARTQLYDDGLERVEFWGTYGSNDPILLCVDECVPDYTKFTAGGPLWQGLWDTKETDEHGEPIYPDGTWVIEAIAFDLAGNPEVADGEDVATVIVDNTEPNATPDLDPLTTDVETGWGEWPEFTVERNGFVKLFARTDSERDDDIVEFMFKRTRDLNLANSWTSVPNSAGIDSSDLNPDYTRPYDFDWDLNKLATPLAVGEKYDVACYSWDLVNNSETQLLAFEDERYVQFKIVDSIAPCATITSVKRRTGNRDIITMPEHYDMIYARDFEYLRATVLNYQNDCERVEFMYAPVGSNDVTLIDAQVTQYPNDPYTWQITNWDLAALDPGVVYEVFAVAVDDVGNMDFDPTTGRPECGGYFTLTVDVTPPTFTWVTPDPTETLIMKECAVQGLSAALETGTTCYDHGADETYGPSLAECGRIQVWGSYAGSVVDPTYTITITGGGTTFTWQKTGGAPVAGVAIDTNVYLADGVWVSFINGTAGAASFADDDVYTFNTQGLIYDLTFTSDDIDIDRDEVYWEYKKVEEPDGDEFWRFGSVFPYDVLYDGQTKMYSTSLDVSTLEDGLYNLRLTVDDLSGNRTTKVMTDPSDATQWFVLVVDHTDPTIALTNVVIKDPAGGDDQVITPVDFGTPTDVTLGDVITLWATADDDEVALPGDPDMYETGVKDIIFEASQFGGSSYDWQEIGFWHAPDETQIPLEVTASVDWNVSGLYTETIYVVRARAADDMCNDEGYSAVVYLNVTDVRAPRARIAGFDPWTENHGDERKTFCDIYALAYCDAPITQVQFQYNVETNVVDDEGWIPIGIPDRCEHDNFSWTDEVWKTTIELTETNFTVGDEFYLRAIATDDTPLQDQEPPWVKVRVVEYSTPMPDNSNWSDATLDLMVVGAEGDDAILSDPMLTMQGGDEPGDAIAYVTTGDNSYDPHMLYIEPDASCGDWVALSRNIESDVNWAGNADLERDNCGRMSFFASVLVADEAAGACRIVLKETDIWSHEVTYALGSNGTAWVPGYMSADAVGDTTASQYLWAGANVPHSATTDFDECLFLMKADAPVMSVDQARYLTLVPRTCYYIGFPYNDVDFDNGYYPTVTIQYDEEALMEVFGDDWAEKEPYLTPRVWYADDSVGDDSWWGYSISHVTVHTELNQVTFHINELDRDMPFFALFLPTQEAPVVVSTFRPAGPMRWGRHNYTDATPVITAYLHASSGDSEPIDEDTIELWIDGQIMAANGVPWVRGAGQLTVEQANPDATIYEVIYRHSFLPEDWLQEGWHTLNILYKHDTGVDEWIELHPEAWGADFYVDTTPPVIEFDGGFVNNPVLKNVSGYVRAFEEEPRAESMLKFQVKDLGGAGPYLRPEHTVWVWDVDCSDGIPADPRHEYYEGTYYPTGDSTGCWTEVNYGIKYDLWLVDLYEDDQLDIDEFEERILLHTGTVDEMVPYMYPAYYADGNYDRALYDPDSTLEVGIPIMAGGMVDDGDVLEVTLYSAKSIEQFSDSLQTYILYDTLYVGSGSPVVVFSGEYRTDRQSQEMHTYQYGVFDYAWNVGSDYIEKRFVVDSSAPQVSLIAPADGYTVPGEDFTFQIGIDDAKSGGGTVSWELLDAHGDVVDSGDGAEGTISDLPMGEYTLKVTAADALGNTTVMSLPIHAQSRILGLTETYIYPNPFNPGDIEGMVHFNLSKAADVTIKVYDFAGEFVRTLASGDPMPVGAHSIPWGGQAGDGTDLANGAYMIRVEANDGSTTKGATIKAVIWRE